MRATQAFSGFSSDQRSFVSVPDEFFRELLPYIQDINELKVILYALWFFQQRGGIVRYIRAEDFQKNPSFMAGLVCGDASPQQALSAALMQAVERGVLLRGTVLKNDEEIELFFLNTPLGRSALKAIQAGNWRFTQNAAAPVEIGEEPPNIYRLYEAHIGPLTPLIAETLREAEETYPPEWIGEAVQIAVEKNARNWRYVEAILRRWKEEGKGERKTGADSQETLRKYSEQWRKPSRKSR
ncbi:MAG: DnaD domain protein [Anaerolineales bacterium]|nr:DnaD domain protein [Anaerolineales bacterium]